MTDSSTAAADAGAEPAEQPLHEHLRRHARATPGKTAIVWYGREIGYGELDRLSDACAAVLHRHGVRQGEPVALFMQNCPQYVIAHIAIQKLGAIVSPCSPLFKSHELAYQLADLGAQVMIAAGNLQPIVEAVRHETPVRTVMLVHYEDMLPAQPSYAVPQELRGTRTPAIAGDNAIDLLAAIRLEQTPPPRPVLAMDDVALLVYTSGTTGRPKGAMLSFRNALFKTAGIARMAELQADDVHLAIPPLYHISGMLYGMNIPLYTGAAAVLHYRFDARATLESMDRHKVSYWKGIAPMLVAVMEAPGAADFDLSSLRVTSASSFGIRLTPELSERWARFTGGCIATEAGYGLSETHTGDVITLPHSVRWGTNGQPMPGVRCRIVDPASGRELPPGEQGEIVLQSPGNFRGYWKQPAKTAETLRDGWVYTGDIGKLDQDGYLSLLGRIKELIKVSGYSVFPEDVEALLLKHPAIRQAAVVGVPDPQKGEVVRAVVVLEEEAALGTEELIGWCRENMSAYKVPRQVEFRTGLPTTASGKVLRRLL
jgi:long-chain acyl-CoA synthetase